MTTKSDFKAPPSLSRATTFEIWLKEIEIWRAFTSLEAKKQGPAIFLTLEGAARESVLQLEIAKISSDTGVKEITDHLSKIYLKDPKTSTKQA